MCYLGECVWVFLVIVGLYLVVFLFGVDVDELMCCVWVVGVGVELLSCYVMGLDFL